MTDVDTSANIARAIARSRRARRAMQTRRRRLALAAGACIAAAVPLSFSLLGVGANDLADAAVTQAKSLSDLLDGRSPGERTAAQLTKTKHKRSAASALFSRIAPPDRGETAPPAAGGGDLNEASQLLAGAPPIAVAPPIAEVAFNPPTLAAIIGGSGPGNPSAPPSGGGAPPSGGGGAPSVGGAPPASGGGPASFPTSEPREPVTPVIGGSGPGDSATPPPVGGPVSFPTSEPREPLTPVSAVPEPATWATMLLGFGLLGWRLRRRAAAPAAKRSAA